MHARMQTNNFNGFVGMEIRYSKYNHPFVEPSTDQVHYISLDDQYLIRAGLLDAHIRLFYSTQWALPTLRPYAVVSRENHIEINDPLTGTTGIFLVSEKYIAPALSKSIRTHDDKVAQQLAYSSWASDPKNKREVDLLDELSKKFGVKAASRRIGRL